MASKNGLKVTYTYMYKVASMSMFNNSLDCLQVMSAAFPNLWSGLWVTKVELWKTEGVFRCIPIFALSFGCHS